jgi:hypothetical protein
MIIVTSTLALLVVLLTLAFDTKFNNARDIDYIKRLDNIIKKLILIIILFSVIFIALLFHN